jgi:hypothetical protein
MSFSANCKASTENTTLMAAVKRCATQKQGTKVSCSADFSVRPHGCNSWHVKTNSTLLQTTLRADFALPFAENEV